MPLNEIENHPYLNYFINQHEEDLTPWDKYDKMIIGSFPIHSITDTVFPDVELRSLNGENDLNFFYGSVTNKFWMRLSQTLNTCDPKAESNSHLRREAAIKILDNNNIILTDVVKATNRFINSDNFSPNDSALFNLKCSYEIKQKFSLNYDIGYWIIKSQNLTNFYFTSQKGIVGKNPGGWFHQILKDCGFNLTNLSEKDNHIKYLITKENFHREIDLFFLPTPSGFRSISLGVKRQHKMFLNYLESVDKPLFYSLTSQKFIQTTTQKDEVSVYRRNFIATWWCKYLIEKDSNFDGTITVEQR